MTVCEHSRLTAGCPSCQARRRRYNQRRRRAQAAGTWQPSMPADQVRAHLTALHRHMTLPAIAAAARVPASTVNAILYGHRRWVTGPVAQAILAVDVPTCGPPTRRSHVDATGTVRRLRALAADGHTYVSLAGRLELNTRHLRAMAYGRHPTVTATTAAKIAALFDKLAELPPPTGLEADKARRRAARKGWPGSGAWAGVDIDDPAAQPVVGDGVDDVAIAQAIARQRPVATLHPNDQAELYRRLVVEQGLSPGQVIYRLGLSRREYTTLARAWNSTRPEGDR